MNLQSYVDEYAEAEAMYNAAPAPWWQLYNQWKQGLPIDVKTYAFESLQEPILEAARTLPLTADVYAFVREALRVLRRQRAAVEAARLRSDGSCPKCGERGGFIRGALCCPTHGAYAGI